MATDVPKVLVVDDDERFAATLAQALERRGWACIVAHTANMALARAAESELAAAVVDLRIGADDGLSLVPALRATGPQTRILVLTGYASIATAVRAIKLGADDYVAKPTTASAIDEALRRGGRGAPVELTATPMSPRRLEWEHIQRVLTDNDGNVSATARNLNMHRRTLQRKLAKRPVSD